jgi:SCP-2 sterol transfer family
LQPWTHAEVGSPTWWRLFIDAWNRNEHRRDLGGLGGVRFEVTDAPFPPACISWDRNGIAGYGDDDEDTPRFSATRETWLRFINGTLTATMGLLQGKIAFRGDLKRILPYSIAFNRIAEVARSCSVETKQGRNNS